MAALALGFTACDDKSDLGIAQVNPQEPIVSAEGLTLSTSAAYNSLIDLQSNPTGTIDIATVASAEGFAEGTTFTLQLAVAKDESMAGAKLVNINDGKVEAEALSSAITALYNVDPTLQRPWLGIAAYANNGSQSARLGGQDFYYVKRQGDVLPVDIALDVESTYYLGGTISQKMDHGDSHAYIDPTFVALFEVSADQAAAGFEWCIVPGSVYGTTDPAQCYGPSGEKTLALGGSGTITAPGRYRLTVNMLDKTYELGMAYEVLYTPGSGNGWSQAASQQLYTADYTSYFGVTRTGAEGDAKGEFKLCATLGWDINWGLNGGVLTPGGDNIVTEPAGLYWVVANLNSLTCSLLQVQTVGIIGLNGDWNSDIVLTPNSDMLVWTGEMTATSATEFKFRFNGGWDANLGGTMDKLVMNGDNMPVSAGTYAVTLDMTQVPYTCTLTAK